MGECTRGGLSKTWAAPTLPLRLPRRRRSDAPARTPREVPRAFVGAQMLPSEPIAGKPERRRGDRSPSSHATAGGVRSPSPGGANGGRVSKWDGAWGGHWKNPFGKYLGVSHLERQMMQLTKALSNM